MINDKTGDDPWAWWQTIRLRMAVRNRMKPIHPDKAHRWKLIVAGCYCGLAAFIFHAYAIAGGVHEYKPKEHDVALETLNEGKIISMENFKIKKIQDYKSRDFDHKIKRTNQPSRIFDQPKD